MGILDWLRWKKREVEIGKEKERIIQEPKQMTEKERVVEKMEQVTDERRKFSILWKYGTGCSVWSVAITPDGEYIAAGSLDSNVYFFASSYAISKIIENVKLIVSQIKPQYNVEEAEIILLQAEQAFNKGDYSNAKELALKAKSLAFDIDQDGVPNEKDFAPYINNYYIYTGIAIMLIFAVSVKIYCNYRKRKKEYERKINEYRSIVEK